VNAFGVLEPAMLPAFLRRLTVCAVVLGAVGFVVALLFGSPLGAVGIILGVAVGFLNIRAVDRQVSSTDVDADATRKAVRKAVGSRSLFRLGAITVVAVALVVIEPPLGIGIVVGLVVFQLAFVGNVIGAALARGGLE
jgi:hypothetical protein